MDPGIRSCYRDSILNGLQQGRAITVMGFRRLVTVWHFRPSCHAGFHEVAELEDDS